MKPDCLAAARNSGRSARLGSPSKNSSPSMKIEGSISARSGSSMSSWTSLGPKCSIDARKGGGTNYCEPEALTSFKDCNIFL